MAEKQNQYARQFDTSGTTYENLSDYEKNQVFSVNVPTILI